MASSSLDERFSLLRRRVQWRIADVLHAVDKATGSTLERRILCFTLDRLGGDGTCSFLNEDPVQALERGINEHVRWLEERAVGHVELQLDVANEQITEVREVVRAAPREPTAVAVRRSVGERLEIEQRAKHLWELVADVELPNGIGGAMVWLLDSIDRAIADKPSRMVSASEAGPEDLR